MRVASSTTEGVSYTTGPLARYGPDLEAVSILVDRPAWHADAACQGMGPTLFFLDRGERTAEAKAVCARCPVIDDCAVAGGRERFGIWGGESERGRKAARRARNRTAA